MRIGTKVETRRFMSICIETVNNFDLGDLITPVFIFERLCNIIYMEEIVDNKAAPALNIIKEIGKILWYSVFHHFLKDLSYLSYYGLLNLIKPTESKILIQ